jgi:Transposase DDE domain group 1
MLSVSDPVADGVTLWIEDHQAAAIAGLRVPARSQHRRRDLAAQRMRRMRWISTQPSCSRTARMSSRSSTPTTSTHGSCRCTCLAGRRWAHKRRVITCPGPEAQGTHARFGVAKIGYEAVGLYELVYRQCGATENRINEAQLDLYGTRACCRPFIANACRLLLSTLTCTLMQRLRAQALQGGERERFSLTSTPSIGHPASL